MDDYRNLTLKSLSLLSFVREQMSSSPDLAMVLKVDDDVLVDPFALRDLLEEEESGRQQDGFMCRVNRNATVDRKESSKWSAFLFLSFLFSRLQEKPFAVKKNYLAPPHLFFLS